MIRCWKLVLCRVPANVVQTKPTEGWSEWPALQQLVRLKPHHTNLKFFFFFDVSVMVNILRERTSPMPDLLLHVHNGPNSLCCAAGRRDKVWVIFLHFLSRTDSICFELKTLIRTTFPSTQSPFSFLLPGVLSVTGGFDAFTFFTAMSLYLHPLCGSAGSITFSQQAHCLPMC